MKNTFKLVQILQNLNRIKRTGGGMFLGLPENMRVSIAEHSYTVANLVMIFAKAEKIDDKKLIKYAMVHDWTDCIVGDLPSGSPSWKSFWEVDIRSETKKAEDNSWKAIEKLVEEEIDLSDLRSEKLDEKETLIFEMADITALLLEMLEWKYMGVKHDGWEMVWFNTIDRMKKIELKLATEWVEMLNQAYEKGTKDYNVFLAKPQLQANPEHKL